ncbi:peptidoglycan recognition protein family protein [Comamonas composti]|uniref:peptidoglycan recognition protein family protein n=1 Tax=Comamonas composti TaxID=408558 RepID=UPI00041CC9EB|nr:peptidoglycan recognition family protein [Comamonas composti]
MLYITKDGLVDATKIIIKIFPRIERGTMNAVNGIVVHQTGAPMASSTFHSYSDLKITPNGAHFLIDKNGTIYQTASLYRVTNHVGLMQSRCLNTKKCTPTELKHAQILMTKKPFIAAVEALHKSEEQKIWPDRYPSNADSIGIECVGEAPGDPKKEVYVPLTDAQQDSLKWLIKELVETLGVSMQEVYRHPEIGRKNATEARTAQW